MGVAGDGDLHRGFDDGHGAGLTYVGIGRPGGMITVRDGALDGFEVNTFQGTNTGPAIPAGNLTPYHGASA